MQKSPGLRERKKAEQKQRIIDVAVDLLSKKGLEDVTVEEISEKSDITKKTFYNYFPSKQDLIEGLSQTLLLAESDKNYALAIEKYDTTAERLEFFLSLQGRNLSGNEQLERNLIKHAMLDLSENSERSKVKLENNILIYEKLFEEGLKQGDVNDGYTPRFLAEMVAGAMNTTAINWMHFPEYPLNERFTELKKFILEMAIKSD